LVFHYNWVGGSAGVKGKVEKKEKKYWLNRVLC
jgi:hypothetical protein